MGKDWPYDDRDSEKIFRQKTSEPGWETESSFAMRRGARLEPTARFLTEQRYGIEFYPVCCQSIANGWQRASLDGIGLHKGKPILLEIKCLDWQKHQLALMGQPPLIYMPQLQWQLHVTGLDECWYCSYSDNLKRFSERDQLALIKIRKNESVFKEQVLPEVVKFWQRIQQWRKENGAS
jgi:putative phage-type endonuclease